MRTTTAEKIRSHELKTMPGGTRVAALYGPTRTMLGNATTRKRPVAVLANSINTNSGRALELLRRKFWEDTDMDLVDTKLEPPHLQRNAAEFQIIRDIAAGGDDGPVLMINMNGYYHEAGYPDGELYQSYIQGLGPFLQRAGGLLLCRMPVYGQAVGQQHVDEIVFCLVSDAQGVHRAILGAGCGGELPPERVVRAAPRHPSLPRRLLPDLSPRKTGLGRRAY